MHWWNVSETPIVAWHLAGKRCHEHVYLRSVFATVKVMLFLIIMIQKVVHVSDHSVRAQTTLLGILAVHLERETTLVMHRAGLKTAAKTSTHGFTPLQSSKPSDL